MPPPPALDITTAPAGYHSEAQMEAAITEAVDRAGTRVHHRVIGHSVLGRPLRAVTIAAVGHTPSAERPHCVIHAGMHGVEVIGSELALHLLGALTDPVPSPSASALLDVADVTVIPCANPDGRQASMASLVTPLSWRHPRAPAPRRNAGRVDLNRNWPWPDGVSDHWLPIAGSPNPRLPWYRGPRPLSEPESRAVLGVLEDRPAEAMLDLHSSGQILIYPWTSKVEPPPDEAGYWAMIDALRARQTRWTYNAKQSRAWYPIVGSMDDYVYERFGTLLLTVEIGRPAESVRRHPGLVRRSFWLANPRDPAAHLANDGEGCLDALLAGVHYRADVPRPETADR